LAARLAKKKHLVFICGHYEGVDERVKKYIDEEISIGEYVLTGGELAAAVILDSVTRLLPGVLGDDQSHVDESHETPGVLEYPHYTRPENFRGDDVPKVLLSGHHAEIDRWKKESEDELLEKSETQEETEIKSQEDIEEPMKNYSKHRNKLIVSVPQKSKINVASNPKENSPDKFGWLILIISIAILIFIIYYSSFNTLAEPDNSLAGI